MVEVMNRSVLREHLASRLRCFECARPMQLKTAPNLGTFYGCTGYPDCRVTHGAHPDGRPMGTPADKATRAARSAAHAVFDPIWRSCMSEYPEPGKCSSRRLESIARRRVYGYLAHRMQIDSDACHIAFLTPASAPRLFGCSLASRTPTFGSGSRGL